LKRQFVNELKNNDQVNDYFVLTDVEQRPYRDTSKGNFLQLIIQDKTGTIPAKLWSEKDQTKTIAKFLSDAQVIKILGKVDDYQGNLSIVLTEPPEKVMDYDTPEDFLVKTDKDILQMLQSLKDNISNISNPHIKQLLELFSNDEKFMEKFSKSPAAKVMHHNFIGGLLEHVLNLIAASKTIHSSHPELDLDLLIAASILHDIGKIDEYDTGLKIEISEDGRFYGHISIGYRLVASKIEEISDFPEELEKKILHIILSHHGEKQYGSPIEPIFPEAVAFHNIDKTDASIQNIKQTIQNDNKDGDWAYDSFQKKVIYKK
tara:strand:- start:101 stop:1054 length:954 start_codon:yes stop_codon:yes gene_type:complete